MTIQCRNVLNGLRKLSSSTEDVLWFVDETYYICLDSDSDTERKYDYTKYKGEIHGIIKQLVMDGYLEYDSDDDGDVNELYFALTHKGLHPYQLQWDAFKSFLFRSVLVPVIVSLATTVLTLLVEAWLLSL